MCYEPGKPSQYRDYATGWTTVVLFPAGGGDFFLRDRVQTGSVTHPTSYPMATGCSFPGGKAVGAWSWPRTST